MRRPLTVPMRLRISCATPRPAFSISLATGTPAFVACWSRVRVWSAVTSFMARLLPCRYEVCVVLESFEQPATFGLRVLRRLLLEADDRRHGVLAGMREANVEAAEAERSRALAGPAVEEEQGLAASIGQDFDLAPGDAADAGAERLHRRFLGGEAGRELVRAVAGDEELRRGEDAGAEAVAVALEEPVDAADFDEIDADGKGCHGSFILAQALGARIAVVQPVEDLAEPTFR